jgi:hypothetical protein
LLYRQQGPVLVGLAPFGAVKVRFGELVLVAVLLGCRHLTASFPALSFKRPGMSDLAVRGCGRLSRRNVRVSRV